MQTVHLTVYSYNGFGVPIIDIFSMIFQFLSEIAMSCLLVMLAHGWTLLDGSFDWDNFEVYLPLVSIVIAAHLIIAGMTYIDNEADHRFHDYAGYQGVALIICKLVLYFYFLYAVCSTTDSIPKRSKDFFRKNFILGSLYLLATPLVIITSFFFIPYSRESYVTIALFIVQTTAMGLFL